MLAGTPRSMDTLEVGASSLQAAVPTSGMRTGRTATYKRVSPTSSNLKTCKGGSSSAAEFQMWTKHAFKKK